MNRINRSFSQKDDRFCPFGTWISSDFSAWTHLVRPATHDSWFLQLLDTFYKVDCIYFFNCIAQNKFIWPNVNERIVFCYDESFVCVVPVSWEGERRSCTITMFVSRDRGTLGSTLRKNRKFRVLPGVTDCSHIVTSLTPLDGKTVQFRCKSTTRGKKRVATKWQSSIRSLKVRWKTIPWNSFSAEFELSLTRESQLCISQVDSMDQRWLYFCSVIKHIRSPCFSIFLFYRSTSNYRCSLSAPCPVNVCLNSSKKIVTFRCCLSRMMVFSVYRFWYTPEKNCTELSEFRWSWKT